MRASGTSMPVVPVKIELPNIQGYFLGPDLKESDFGKHWLERLQGRAAAAVPHVGNFFFSTVLRTNLSLCKQAILCRSLLMTCLTHLISY